jgi:hypothetical protein
MANEMRDRLVELLGEFGIWHKPMKEVWFPQAIEKLADHLIANGVVVPPCKVGDTVYYLDGSIIVESKVHCISFGGRYGDYKGGQMHIYDSDKDNITVKLDNFGKTVFLTKEAAEQKLKEMRGDTNA